ncbi:hypothetical protein ACWGF2_25795 [Streptomyces sp. NPDC054919]
MKRNVRAVDWDTEVKDTIDEALEHVRSRSEAETMQKERVNQLLEATADDRKRRQLQDLAELIHECWKCHAVLIKMLMEVGPEFRRQQDRQVFVAPAIHTRVHLHEQLLQPVLEISLDACLAQVEPGGELERRHVEAAAESGIRRAVGGEFHGDLIEPDAIVLPVVAQCTVREGALGIVVEGQLEPGAPRHLSGQHVADCRQPRKKSFPGYWRSLASCRTGSTSSDSSRKVRKNPNTVRPSCRWSR